MKQYYYTKGPKRYGPATREELNVLSLDTTTMIWLEGMDYWRPIAEFPELNTVSSTPGNPYQKTAPSTNTFEKNFKVMALVAILIPAMSVLNYLLNLVLGWEIADYFSPLITLGSTACGILMALFCNKQNLKIIGLVVVGIGFLYDIYLFFNYTLYY